MRIFLTGANGQLGRSVIEKYKKAESIFLATRDILDVSDKAAVLKAIKDFRPDFVFHFASLTRGDENAKNPEQAKEINVTGTRHVVEACKLVNAGILFVSTNEVFDGESETPYTEISKPHPITTVGKMKLEAEQIIREQMEKYYIIRSMWLYSRWSGNFIHNVLDRARKVRKVAIVIDEIGSPTYSSDLVAAIEQLVQTKKYGTYHLVNEGVASRLDFAKKAFALCKLTDVEIIPTTLEQYKRVSKPPKFSALANTKAAAMGIRLRPWEKALESFLRENNMIEGK